MPAVQENLLALSKLRAVSKWIDLRVKGEELVKKINEDNCKILVAFDGVLEEIIKNEKSLTVEKILVVSPLDYLPLPIKTLAKLKSKETTFELKSNSKYAKYMDFLKSGKKNSSVQAVPLKKDRISIIIQSSGSTGTSKSIAHTEYNFNMEMVHESYSDMPLDKAKIMHVAIPPFIIYGLCNSVYASMYFGMKAVMSPYVADNTVFDDLGKFDTACAAPVHYRYIYKK